MVLKREFSNNRITNYMVNVFTIPIHFELLSQRHPQPPPQQHVLPMDPVADRPTTNPQQLQSWVVVVVRLNPISQ